MNVLSERLEYFLRVAGLSELGRDEQAREFGYASRQTLNDWQRKGVERQTLVRAIARLPWIRPHGFGVAETWADWLQGRGEPTAPAIPARPAEAADPTPPAVQADEPPIDLVALRDLWRQERARALSGQASPAPQVALLLDYLEHAYAKKISTIVDGRANPLARTG